MPRLNTIEPASATGRAKEIFDGPLAGKHLNIFKGMANSPAVLDTYLGIAGALANASLSSKEQEAIQLVVAEANNCDYCLGAHTMIGKGAGLTEEQTIQARKGAITDDAKLEALTRFASAVHEKKGFVSDEDIANFKSAGYDDGAVAEVAAVYAQAVFTNFFNHINETDLDLPAAPSI